jgi:hypothetical protein
MTSPPLAWKAGEIYFSQIDWSDTTFSLTYHRPLDPLIRSIRAIGLQHPAVLQENGQGRFRIVAGARRLRALQARGVEPFACWIAGNDTEQKNLILWSFYDNLDRGFNSVEQVLAVKKLYSFIPEKEFIEDYLPLLGLAPKKEILRRYLSVAEISPSYRMALFLGRLFPETMERVRRDFPSQENCILALFIFLQWGFQKQKEFLNDLGELSKRSGHPPETILLSNPLLEIMGRVPWSPQQKGTALRKYFRTILFPTLTDTEQAFSRALSPLNLDQRTRLSPPPYFEGGHYHLEITFSNNRELSESIGRILPSLEKGKFDSLP